MFSVFFVIFLLGQSKIGAVKVDKGLLHDIITVVTIFGAICFGTPKTRKLINSRTAIAGAIIALLLVFFISS